MTLTNKSVRIEIVPLTVLAPEVWWQFTAQKVKFFIKGLFSKCDQIWSYLLYKFFMKLLILGAAIFVNIELKLFLKVK